MPEGATAPGMVGTVLPVSSQPSDEGNALVPSVSSDDSARPPSPPPVCSWTIEVSVVHAQHFLDASAVLMKELAEVKDESLSLAQRLYRVARVCPHPAVSQFMRRIQLFSLSNEQTQAALLLFANHQDWSTKLDSMLQTLPHREAVALFHAILVAISCCTTDLETSSSPTNLQSASFDGSLASLRDEGDQTERNSKGLSALKHELDEVASFAANDLFKFHETHRDGKDPFPVDAKQISFWYREGGGQKVAPWLDLLDVSKWQNVLDMRKPRPTVGRTLTEESNLNKENNHQSNAVRGQQGTGVAPKANEPPPNKDATAVGSASMSRTLVSFDFSSAIPSDHEPLCIQISDVNLLALRRLVYSTSLVHTPTHEVSDNLRRLAQQQGSKSDIARPLCLRRGDFRMGLDQVFPKNVDKQLSAPEKKAFYDSLEDIFGFFEDRYPDLPKGEVDVAEFSVGFSFFCAGTKSVKLAAGFEILDTEKAGYLNQGQLQRYVECYLTMLVAMSLLVPAGSDQKQKAVSIKRRQTIKVAVQSGAKWTLGHFYKYMEEHHKTHTFHKDGRCTFALFAGWYSAGGFNVAPWLELLDLRKTLSLVAVNNSNTPLDAPPPVIAARGCVTTGRRPPPRDRVSSLRRHHSARRLSGPGGSVIPPTPMDILFTFPLGSRRSLVVLKEDAGYVRSVVDQLGLLSLTPDELWSTLTQAVRKNRKGTELPANKGKPLYVNLKTFLECMKLICPTIKSEEKRPAPGSTVVQPSSVYEILSNFYQCFDLEQVDSVALDELMGGLCLLCGGKKSTKLAFAFSIFETKVEISGDKRKAPDRLGHLLRGEDLFLFLRSVLIVTFSCCRQSLDMTDEMVGQWITDTSNLICNDVMHHQFSKRQTDTLSFDDFGDWYNDGGFERAPWLELLDLRKWVVVESSFDRNVRRDHPIPALNPSSTVAGPKPNPRPKVKRARAESVPHLVPVQSRDDSLQPMTPHDADPDCPPPPPEDSLDPSFFEHGLINMDSMDDMDMIFMNHDDDRDPLKLVKSFSFSPRQHLPPTPRIDKRKVHPLHFQITTSDTHSGWNVCLSSTRMCHFRYLLEQTGLHKVDTEAMCNKILKASKADHKTMRDATLTRAAFDSVFQSIFSGNRSSPASDSRALLNVLGGVYDSFDRSNKGKARAMEIACGCTILCQGKKSDKLEFAFEVLDKKSSGRMTEGDVARYLGSFITVLLSIALSPCLEGDPDVDSLTTVAGERVDKKALPISKMVDKASKWAASIAFGDFKRRQKNGKAGEVSPSMSFNDFADWYTLAGHQEIPWLELLDLRKWVMTPETL
jgi:Ca2+-binding EF-hand superfamily protein